MLAAVTASGPGDAEVSANSVGLPDSRTTGTLAGVGDEGPDFCFDSLKAKRGSQRSAPQTATEALS